MIKKAIGFFISFAIVVGVLFTFGVRYIFSIQDQTMRSVFGQQQVDGLLEEGEQTPVVEEKEDSFVNEILLIVLLVGIGMTVVFGVLLFNEVQNNKAAKEKLNMAAELMIQKERDKKEHEARGEEVTEIVPKATHSTRFELGGFVESEMNRLLIENYEGPDKKLTVMSDMNLLSNVIEKITDKIGSDVNVKVRSELAASIVFTGDNMVFEDDEIEKISGIVTEAMGSFVFENNEAIIKLPIIPDFG